MFGSYLELGFEHILDPQGIDHVLFLLALAVPFLLKDWKSVVLLATAFTLGHSLTLALSALNIVNINSNLVELLIAVSICIAAISNFLSSSKVSMKTRYLTAGFFGLIHGMGFSNFFKSILGKNDILMPLLAFNLGVEIAQLLIILAMLIISWIIVNKLKIKAFYWVSAVSIIVLLMSIKMIVERI